MRNGTRRVVVMMSDVWARGVEGVEGLDACAALQRCRDKLELHKSEVCLFTKICSLQNL